MNKSQLRRFIAEALRQLSDAEKQRQSAIVFERLIAHPKYEQAERVSIYLSTDNEVNTEPILRHALEVAKKRCFVPYVRGQRADGDSTSRMVMVELNSMADYEALPVNGYGIKEPRLEAPPTHTTRLDLILVPGVAFSPDGRRLGHGKGYYDEFLAQYAEWGRPTPHTIGLALSAQLVEDLSSASDQHDVRLAELLTAQ